MSHNPLMDDLTPAQQQAVEHRDGPLLILAGPGSGKTRVVTRRIANLLEHGVRERNILAITFTNKAAGEMASRVKTLAPGSKVWVSTFHRFCSYLLRIHGEQVGLKSNFTILDTTDQKQAVRSVMSELDLDTAHYSPDKVLWRISNAKNDLLTPDLVDERFEHTVRDHWDGIVRKVYRKYQEWLLASNAVDFDDLLLHVALLLEENSELRAQLGDRYRYILVDEYQDTNLAQYKIVAALAQRNRNLCVTGDPDQSIYGWRGARIENILRFESDFPEAKVIRLEQNFRSLPPILEAADALIVNNQRRKHKDLTTEKTGGDPVKWLRFDGSLSEAEGIAGKILEIVSEHGGSWNDFAIFYRVNSLSRQIETSLTRHRIPFQVAAGVAFFDRAEIRDLLAYLRLIENPADRAAFVRIVNKPARGLGKTSVDRLLAWADQQKLTAWSAAARAKEVPKLTKKAAAGFQQFAAMLDEFAELTHGHVSDLLERVIERTRYAVEWRGVETEESIEHLANVDELVSAARQYDEQAGDEGSLQGFLEQTALVSDTDRIEESAGRVTLMTLHAAKGLEFPNVFIVGVEDGLLPHERSKKDGDSKQIEEERRLLFVGITRAKQRLFLTQSTVRSMHGRSVYSIASPFLFEIRPEEVDCRDEQATWNLLRNQPSLVDGLDEDDDMIDDGGDDGEVFIEVELPLDDDDRVDWSRMQATIPSPSQSAEETEVDVSTKANAAKAKSSLPKQSPPRPAPPKLTTGAALLEGTSTPASLPTGFSVGQQVRHPRYGRGVVRETGGGSRRSVTVVFEDGDRTETFIVGKAPLQPVG